MTSKLLYQAFLVKIMIISFLRVVVNTYVPIFQDLDAQGGRKLRTDTHTHTHIHTHTHGTTTVTLAVRMRAEG